MIKKMIIPSEEGNNAKVWKANFNIANYDETDNYGKFVIEPLERGFGTTLGNSLRRVLLSSLPGSAVYAIKVQGAIHEFSAVDGVVEDVTSIILSLKKLVFDVDSDESATMIIDVEGPATCNRCWYSMPFWSNNDL